jgi:hypothetical protein
LSGPSQRSILGCALRAIGAPNFMPRALHALLMPLLALGLCVSMASEVSGAERGMLTLLSRLACDCSVCAQLERASSSCCESKLPQRLGCLASPAGAPSHRCACSATPSAPERGNPASIPGGERAGGTQSALRWLDLGASVSAKSPVICCGALRGSRPGAPPGELRARAPSDSVCPAGTALTGAHRSLLEGASGFVSLLCCARL